jgi:L-seryl-tRNA(Ser) seleniumtransferase
MEAKASRSELYRQLPQVDGVLRMAGVARLAAQEGVAPVTTAVRTVLDRVRQEIGAGRLTEEALQLAISGLEDAVEQQLRDSLSHSLRPVINATGVILHTNLGRAPLSNEAIEHIRGSAATYSNLEFDLNSGERGKRDVHVDRLFQRLLAGDDVEKETVSGPEFSTIVVNNNAAAVLLAINSLAEGGEVVVSRGELVEIGGSFRIPDVMAKSNAVLREVGTTNRTRLADYERAINEKTRLLLRVHRSNFQITGFTEQPQLRELAALSQKRNIPLMEDLGSGALFDLRSVGVEGEPGVIDSLRAGVDVVTYSGDKLLGGPQAGILTGKPEFIQRIRINPLFRALRVDKLTYAALEATLLAYVKRDHDSIPALRMMRVAQAEIGKRAEAVAREVGTRKLSIEIIDGESLIGGGAAPSAILPTRLLAATCEGLSADALATRLRQMKPPIVARVEEARVLFDLRTVFPEQDASLVRALIELSSS